MSDKLSAKSRMAEMYPVKMASGGIIGNIGRLQAAALGIQPQYKPGEEEYLKQYQDYQTKYNTEFMPQYEAFLPKQQEWVDQYNQYAAQQQAWVDSYNQAQKDLSSGKYDLRIKKDKVGPYFNQGYYTVSTSSNHQILRPRNVEMVFKTPEPTFNTPEPTMSFQEPQAPALPKGFENPEQFQAALAERSKQAEARAKGVAVFADPGRYNLSGFAGSSTFNEPESKAFFAKGGEVDKFIKQNEGALGRDPSEGGLTVKDYPNPYGLRAYQKKDGTYGGEMLPKSVGWAGELEGRGALQGSRVTEYSMEDDKGSFPTINPLLSREEIELVASGIVTPTIYKKAKQWRDMQAEKGASAFLNPAGY
jgi:hypothetical protein